MVSSRIFPCPYIESKFPACLQTYILSESRGTLFHYSVLRATTHHYLCIGVCNKKLVLCLPRILVGRTLIDGLALPLRWRLSSLKTTKEIVLICAKTTAAIQMTRTPRSSGVVFVATARIASTIDNVIP